MSEMLRVLMVEPHKVPYELQLRDTLPELQKAVGGLIEVLYNGDGTLLVCHEEGKLIGMEGNRRIGDGSTIIAGPFFVCGDSGESFRSLTDEELSRYADCFAQPEDISPEEVQADTGFFFFSY